MSGTNCSESHRPIAILRGDFKQSEYGKVILPFIPPSRLPILEASKQDVARTRRRG